jgi:hypothetical protein
MNQIMRFNAFIRGVQREGKKRGGSRRNQGAGSHIQLFRRQRLEGLKFEVSLGKNIVRYHLNQ